MNSDRAVSRQPPAANREPDASKDAAGTAASTGHRSPVTGHAVQPWYREPWPWILMAGPAAAVVASSVIVWLAVTTADGLVADDYDPRRSWGQSSFSASQPGNPDEAAEKVTLTPTPSAAVEARDGMLRVRLTWGRNDFSASSSGNADEAAGNAALSPPAIFAHLVHATRAENDLRLRLARAAPGLYEARLPALPAGRWRLVLEDPRGEWRLTPGQTLPLAKGKGTGGG